MHPKRRPTAPIFMFLCYVPTPRPPLGNFYSNPPNPFFSHFQAPETPFGRLNGILKIPS